MCEIHKLLTSGHAGRVYPARSKEYDNQPKLLERLLQGSFRGRSSLSTVIFMLAVRTLNEMLCLAASGLEKSREPYI